jgi:alpha-ribazole phosphatase
MTLWLLRHARVLIEAGVCYGHLNVPADTQATFDCATRLAGSLPEGITIVSSPLQRCEQLAPVLLGLRPNLAYKTDSRLQEMDFGQWEGRAWAAIPKSELDAWTSNFADYPAGKTGESVARFMARIASAFDEIDTDQHTLWITHAGVIRAARLIAAGRRHITDANQWPMDAPACGQWCKLDL